MMAVVEQKDRTAQGDANNASFPTSSLSVVHRPSMPCYCNSVTVVASATYHIHIEPLDIDA